MALALVAVPVLVLSVEAAPIAFNLCVRTERARPCRALWRLSASDDDGFAHVTEHAQCRSGDYGGGYGMVISCGSGFGLVELGLIAVNP